MNRWSTGAGWSGGRRGSRPAVQYGSRNGGPTMPIHDWTRVRAGRFHHFHQRWIGAIGDVLNGGVLPPNYFALAEQKAGGPEPDVVTLKVPTRAGAGNGPAGTAVADVPPKV